MNKKMVSLLYRSFDGPLTGEEKQQLEQALKNSSELRREKENILAVRERIAEDPEKSFKPFFAERLMSKIYQISGEQKKQELFFESLISIFRPVAIGIVIVLIAILSFNIKKTDQLSLSGALATPQITLEETVNPTLSIAMELSK